MGLSVPHPLGDEHQEASALVWFDFAQCCLREGTQEMVDLRTRGWRVRGWVQTGSGNERALPHLQTFALSAQTAGQQDQERS